jgi:PAS domain S-box-containing protein
MDTPSTTAPNHATDGVAARPPRFISLERQIVLPLGLLFIASALVVGWMMARLHKGHLVERHSAQARLVARSLVALHESGSGREALDAALARLDEETGLALAVVVAGTPPVVVASTDTRWRGLPLEALPEEEVAADLRQVLASRRPAETLHEASGSYDCSVPTGTDGAVMVHIDASDLGSAPFDEAQRLGGVALASLAACALGTALVVRRRVTGRLSQLASGIGRPGGARLPVERRRDEIHALAERIDADQRRMRDMLREHERLAMVARRTNDGIFIFDEHQRIAWINEGAVRITGFPSSELLGRRHDELPIASKTDARVLAEFDAAVERGASARLELRSANRAGATLWLDVEVQPLVDEGGRFLGSMAVASDITAAVLGREELRASERRQTLIVEGAELGTWDWHLPSGQVRFNDHWCRMLGYEPSEIEPHVRSWERILHPDDAQVAWAALQDHFEGRTDFYRCVHRLRAKDGSIMWVHDAGKVYERDAHGNPVRMAGIHLDVSDRRAAEERLELVVEASAVGVWDWNIRANTSWLSPRFWQIVGGEAEENPDLEAWMKRVHPEDRDMVQAAIAAHLQQRAPFDLDYRILHGAGDYRWFHAQAQASWDVEGKPIRMAGSLVDIHERRLAEAELRRMAAIIAGSEDCIYALDAEGRVSSANPAARRLHAEGSAPGCDEALLAPESERVREASALRQVLAGRRVEQYESRRVAADGREFEVSVSIAAIRDESGAIMGASKIVRDISERREKRELAALNSLLGSQNRRLEEMTARAHRFVDDVSHEFRTPLAVIREYSAIIAEGLGGPVSPAQSDWLRAIDVAASDLNGMVEDFLDSSKLRVGRLRVDRRPSSVAAIVAGVRRLLERKASSRGIVLVEDLEPDLPAVFVDEEKARRVVANLVSNAIKFSPQEGRVELAARRTDEGEVRLSVRDHGAGLAPDAMALLFDRFRQLPNALAPSVKGFGLGLNIARQLVWLNLGRIEVKSRLGEGAEFAFTMPTDDMDLVVRRCFERLSERDDPPARVALLLARPAVAGADLESLRRVVVGSTWPSDVVLRSADGGALAIFGPSDDPALWMDRLAQALRCGRPGALGMVEIAGTWDWPAGAAAARAALRELVVGEESHAT